MISRKANVNLVACFTGYRSQKLPWGFNEKNERCLQMTKLLEKEIVNTIKEGYCHFISGMAIGFDMIAAEIVLKLKSKYNIILECAIACKNQEKKWSLQLQTRYQNILKQADIIWCGKDYYVDGCMLERNYYMVNQSSKIIALFDGKSGGTKKTLEYAKQQRLQITILKP